MELSLEEQEKYLYKVFLGMDIVYINEVQVVFKHPTPRLKFEGFDVYNKSYSDAINEGLLPLEKLEEVIQERGIFTKEDQEKVATLESKIKGQKVLLSKTVKVQAKQDRIKEYLSNLNNERNKILSKKYNALLLSAETKAEEDRNMFFCCNCVYVDDKLYWKDYNKLLKEKDIIFKNEILTNFLEFYRGIDTDVIRCLARSNLWRIRYITSQKTSDSLFGVSTSEYTNDMINLAYWSNFYQSVYEMMPEDRPPDLIIEDDEALDAYMTDYYEERKREDQAKRGAAKTKGKLSAFDQEEVIVTQSNELYEDIDYDKPREALRIKGKADIKKRTTRGR